MQNFINMNCWMRLFHFGRSTQLIDNMVDFIHALIKKEMFMTLISLCGCKGDRFGHSLCFIINLIKRSNGLTLLCMGHNLWKNMGETSKGIGIFPSPNKANPSYNLITYSQIVLLPWHLGSYIKQQKMNSINKYLFKLTIIL